MTNGDTMHLWSGHDSDEDDDLERDPTRIDETTKQLWDLWRAGRTEGPDDERERERTRRRLSRAVRALAARAGWRDIALHFGHFDGEAARREWGWAVRERYGTSHLRPDGGPLDVHAYTVLVWAEDARPENVRAVVAEDEEPPGIPAGSVEQGRWWQLTAANRAELWELLRDDPTLDVGYQPNWFLLVRAIRARAAVAAALGVEEEPEWEPFERHSNFDPPEHGTRALVRAVTDVFGAAAGRRQARALGVRAA